MKLLLLLLLALPLFAADHPSQMIDLTDATDFPRFTKEELEQTGFPDHLHKFYWPGYDGELGPGMFCQGKILKAVEGLESPLILIAGGMDKGGSFDNFAKAFDNKVINKLF